MDTQALQAFLAVARQQSFSLAAEQLFLTQSAVSKRIAQLERQINTPLFDRHNRTLSLTEAGLLLAPKAQQILDLIGDTELELQSLNQQVAGKLQLATSHHIGLHRLPPILREFTNAYPKAQLDLSFMGSERAYQAVRQRHVELALSTLDAEHLSDTDPLLNIVPLWTDEMVCVCSVNHALAQYQSLTLEILSQAPAILPEPNTITFKLIERIFQQADLTLYAPMPTNYLETIKMMVSVGMGWSLLPRTLLDDNLHELNWPAAQLTRPLGVIYLRTRTLSNAAKAFLTLMHYKIT